MAAKKKPTVSLSVADRAEASFLATGKAEEQHNAMASKQNDAMAEKHRTMVYLEKTTWRRLKLRLAVTDESATSFIERAVTVLLNAEADR